ncbi:hypothetical protein KR074_009594 [Drosophila pseudoananassae]|nr:hypothetical protein KR074_009594 [Drosophila pseudoananassae]
MPSPPDSWTCLFFWLIWLQVSLLNAALDFLQTAVPLPLVRHRQLEDDERTMAGECTLGALSIRMVAF